jgi:GDP-mannose 6-dehydrogenase
MRPFLVDTQLNISTAYLTPGFAFGGSCLPKDLRALLYAASRRDVSVPMLDSVLESNRECVGRALSLITTYAPCRIGLFGLAFKPGTDDLRESPYVELAERLLGKGYDLRIYDPAVAVARLTGANRDYIQERIPHLSALLSDCIDDVVSHSQVCVVSGQSLDLARHISTLTEAPVVDLCALPRAPEYSNEEAQLGVVW